MDILKQTGASAFKLKLEITKSLLADHIEVINNKI